MKEIMKGSLIVLQNYSSDLGSILISHFCSSLWSITFSSDHENAKWWRGLLKELLLKSFFSPLYDWVSSGMDSYLPSQIFSLMNNNKKQYKFSVYVKVHYSKFRIFSLKRRQARFQSIWSSVGAFFSQSIALVLWCWKSCVDEKIWIDFSRRKICICWTFFRGRWRKTKCWIWSTRAARICNCMEQRLWRWWSLLHGVYRMILPRGLLCQWWLRSWMGWWMSKVTWTIVSLVPKSPEQWKQFIIAKMMLLSPLQYCHQFYQDPGKECFYANHWFGPFWLVLYTCIVGGTNK